MDNYDIIIIGGGPAGLSAATYTSRADFKTLLLDKPERMLENVDLIENYFGFPDGISGKELLEKGRKQASEFGTEILTKEALIARIEGEDYVVETAEESYRAKGLILAPGIQHQKHPIDGIEKFEGEGISYCVVCDAPFYKDKKVGLLGSKNYAAKEAIELSEYTDKITIFTNGEELNFEKGLKERIEDKGIPIVTDEIKRVLGEADFRGLLLEDGEVEMEGLFVAVGTSGTVSFAKSLGIPVEGDTVIVNEDFSTGLPRLYATGDCTGGARQVATAVGEGTEAALNLIEDLREEEYTDWDVKG